MEEPLYRTNEAAKMLGVHRTSLREWTNTKRYGIVGEKIGRITYYAASTLKRALQKRNRIRMGNSPKTTFNAEYALFCTEVKQLYADVFEYRDAIFKLYPKPAQASQRFAVEDLMPQVRSIARRFNKLAKLAPQTLPQEILDAAELRPRNAI